MLNDSLCNTAPDRRHGSSSSRTTRSLDDASTTLTHVAFFLGELRDGLTMINMQSTYLITTKGYSEKQAGVMFFVFGLSQFLFQTPAGYLMDYSPQRVKLYLLGSSAIGTTLLTLVTPIFATDNAGNINLMVFVMFLQGAITALIPPGLNSITQGIVGMEGMTAQVAQNEMMHHFGTTIIVLVGSILAFVFYPSIEFLFSAGPLACIGVIYYLSKIRPSDINHNAARGLIDIYPPTPSTALGMGSLSEYIPPTFDGKTFSFNAVSSKSISSNSSSSSLDFEPDVIKCQPSFHFGFGRSISNDMRHHDPNNIDAQEQQQSRKAETPYQILKDPKLVIFCFICFTFHLSNGSVLPLVMQTLAIGNGRTGILLSGFSIAVGQFFMELSASLCGKKAGICGRKPLFIIGFLSVPVRCGILTLLLSIVEEEQYLQKIHWTIFHLIIVSTQLLDGIGAGIFGIMYVLVTSDLSGGTGRFSLTLGATTAASAIGGTISGYVGQALAQDMGYRNAFIILGYISLVPVVCYLILMPETLPLSSVGSSSNSSSNLVSMNGSSRNGSRNDRRKRNVQVPVSEGEGEGEERGDDHDDRAVECVNVKFDHDDYERRDVNMIIT